MAQHKDIDRASALLEGVQGWHIEYHPESISNNDKKCKRRSRGKCMYYCKGTCNYAHAACMGVSCGAYSEIC